MTLTSHTDFAAFLEAVVKSRTQCKPHIAYGSMQTIRFASTVGGWKQHATLLFAVPIFCDRKHSTAGQ